MKNTKLILFNIFFITSQIALSQVSGNINYQKQIDFSKENNIINPATTMNVTISSKGIYAFNARASPANKEPSAKDPLSPIKIFAG